MSACDLVNAPRNTRQARFVLEQARAELAPTGMLRTAVNLANFLLVTGQNASGDPEGVSPDLARAIADRLGVEVAYVPFDTPGELADAVADDVWGDRREVPGKCRQGWTVCRSAREYPKEPGRGCLLVSSRSAVGRAAV